MIIFFYFKRDINITHKVETSPGERSPNDIIPTHPPNTLHAPTPANANPLTQHHPTHPTPTSSPPQPHQHPSQPSHPD